MTRLCNIIQLLTIEAVDKKKKKFIILVVGEWRSRASCSHLTIMTNFICNRSYMSLEQINIYTNISKISLSMADSVMVFTTGPSVSAASIDICFVYKQ